MRLFRHKNKTNGEIGIIIIGAGLITALLMSSYFITQNALQQNLQNYQNVIKRNLTFQFHLLSMSNSIRDRMLIVHDINLSTDAFEIDDYYLRYNTIAVEFVRARNLLLQLNLPKNQLQQLARLRDVLNSVRNKLDEAISAKIKDNDTVLRQLVFDARTSNTLVLNEIKTLIDLQLIDAEQVLTQAQTKTSNTQKISFGINILAFIVSIMIVIFIIKLLNKRKQLLNKAIIQLENNNANLEQLAISRSNELIELQKEHSKIQAEVEVSIKIQQLILPSAKELELIEQLDIATYLEVAEEMGGDYLDVLPFFDGQLICIGDVTDHGLKSGIIMIMTQSIIRHQSVLQNNDIKQALIDINASLYQNIARIQSDRYLSLSLLFHKDNRLIISGQHEEIIIVRANGTLERINTDTLGFYVGLVEDITEYADTLELHLETNDLVLLHTDGISEAANEKEQLYGIQRLCDQATQHHQLSAQQVIDHILIDLNHFIGDKRLYDDLALIVFKQR